MKYLSLIIAGTVASLLSVTNAQAASQYYNNSYYPANEQCREFSQTVYVGGRAQEGFGTACLQPNGSWKIVSQPQVPATLPSQTVPVRQIIVHEDHYYPGRYYPPRYGYGYKSYHTPRSGITISLGNHHRSNRYYKHRNHHYKHGYSRHRGYKKRHH